MFTSEILSTGTSSLNSQYARPRLHTYICKTEKTTQKFVVPVQYEITAILGSGAYGMVVEAFDTVNKKVVAIKKNHSIFSAHEGDREYHKRILREILILKHFANKEGNDNLISLLDLGYPTDYNEFDEVYLIMEKMDTDLRALIQSNSEISDDHVKYYLYTILLGLKFMHSAGILHRDLKPSNILLDEESELKICDFGLSRGVELSFDTAMSTVQVVTRWYRAPELLLLWDKNTHLAAFDIWSVGCILAELMQKPRRRPIFPGKTHLDQIEQIVKICGKPAPEDMKGVDKALKYMQSLPHYAKRNFFSGQDEYPNQLAVDLLEKMLTFNPEKRITIDEALNHPYLSDIRNVEYEKTCDLFTFRLSDETPTSELRTMIYNECVSWNKQKGIYGTPLIDHNVKAVIME